MDTFLNRDILTHFYSVYTWDNSTEMSPLKIEEINSNKSSGGSSYNSKDFDEKVNNN